MNTEKNSDLYQTLLESTKAIPWKIDWLTQEFSYIGPQIEELLGWPQASWKTITDWVERMHPEDRDRTVSHCVRLSCEGVDHEADYRALKKDGGFVWIRDVVHIIRDGATTVAIIGFMFDISERKKVEEKLNELNDKLEQLSFQDGLTGVANRRAFDKALSIEWRRARRHKFPLSILFADIDFFKEYNDCYGHLKGDDCLKVIAGELSKKIRRPADLVARYGGEEFVVLLPETDNKSAVRLAERCRLAIFNKKLPHERSAVCDFVTVSIGVNTAIPLNGDASSFIENADQLLYQAKSNGRNRIEYQP